MNTQLIKNGRKWSLYGAALAAIAYSALTLTSRPAYAGTCTQTRCATISEACATLCYMHGGVFVFECPLPQDPTDAFCQCNGGDSPGVIPC
jgi:hypothetical protein